MEVDTISQVSRELLRPIKTGVAGGKKAIYVSKSSRTSWVTLLACFFGLALLAHLRRNRIFPLLFLKDIKGIND
ncbi:MAG: hypothetical protein O8C66_14640 [Candidatus Methanoperedens sp.]|nr:hypothetical protein [Candidatus Methanoperedens sp.]MCZ7371739.1 hypothetical protein [Candidatus Methanoperedens sp.]